jgi:hypothetical protein
MFKKSIFLLIVLAIITALIAPTLIDAMAIDAAEAAPTAQNQFAFATPVSTQPIEATQNGSRAQLEEQILNATVRIEMHTQFYLQEYPLSKISSSHATIIGGRYLLTHNHFQFSLTQPVTEGDGQEGYMGISLRSTNGNLLLENAPLSAFQIVHEDPQTLVLSFVAENGRGLFAEAGLPGAAAIDWQSVPWQEGMGLAQVDWDGKTAHVDWARFENLSQAEGVPQIQVANFPIKGSSGGGLFWNGVHVGNTWARNIEEDPDTGEIVRRYSIIALNTAATLDLES